MSIICWTVFYPGSPPASHGVARLASTAVRHFRSAVHHAGLLHHHVTHIAAQPHRWFKLVCRVIPAGLAGGGALLAPHPASPPYLLAPPPAFVEPALVTPALVTPALVAFGPLMSPGGSPRWSFPPELPSSPSVEVFQSTITLPVQPASMPEPSSAAVLVGGVSGILLLRFSLRRLSYATDRIQPSAGETTVLGRSPVT